MNQNNMGNYEPNMRNLNYNPKNSIEEGVVKFANWFKTYYKI